MEKASKEELIAALSGYLLYPANDKWEDLIIKTMLALHTNYKYTVSLCVLSELSSLRYYRCIETYNSLINKSTDSMLSVKLTSKQFNIIAEFIYDIGAYETDVIADSDFIENKVKLLLESYTNQEIEFEQVSLVLRWLITQNGYRIPSTLISHIRSLYDKDLDVLIERN